jgi:ribosomal protein S18 acetylase RimI-like enzyme
MWVNPSYRNSGIAQQLLLSLKPWVKNSGQDFMVCSVYKNNISALNLYLRLGFIQTHEDAEEFHLKWVL